MEMKVIFLKINMFKGLKCSFYLNWTDHFIWLVISDGPENMEERSNEMELTKMSPMNDDESVEWLCT